LQAYPTRNKVLVEGVNRIKKHTAISTNQRGAQSGGIVTQEAAIHVSNVMVVDSDGTPARVGYRVDEETGKRVRISKRNGKDIQA
ncbi:MAG: 50S ribosomal protein L24, partial [Mycobacterium sp.]